MFFIILTILTTLQTPSQDMWALRSGMETTRIPSAPGAPVYFNAVLSLTREFTTEELIRGIGGGDRSLIVPLTALLVSEGRTDLAEIYWGLGGMDLPATRNDLLNALAWFGRYELYPLMALESPVPPDMEGTLHSDQCGAVCALGWMIPREDGLFHCEELVSAADIQRLAGFLSVIDPGMTYLSKRSLDHIFQTTSGDPR